MFENILKDREAEVAQKSEKEQIRLARETNSLSTTDENVLMQNLNGRSDLIFWQQELSQSLEILKNRLRNKIFDPRQEAWITRTKPIKNREGKIEWVEMQPMLTEEGIAMIENQLSCFLGSEAKNMINTNLNETRILKILEDTSNTVADNLVDSYDEYVINPTPSNLDNIMRLVKNAMIPTAFRSINGWTKIQDNTSIKRVDTYTGNANEEPKKRFPAF